MHAVLRGADWYVPAIQAVQIDTPDSAVDEPAGHGEHSAVPGTLRYEPGVHD